MGGSVDNVIITANENIIETELRSKTKDKNPLDEKANRANKAIRPQL